jgi:CHAT domain-containing protein
MTDTPAVVLLEYYGLNGTVVCWAWRAGMAQAQAFPLDVTLQALDALAESAPWLDRAPAPEAQATLTALLAPAAEIAREEDLLWIVPWGPLHQLPLHAALLPDGRPLLERHPVVYSPSASVMGVCRARRRGSYQQAVVLGDTAGDLPDAHAEATAVAARFGAEARLGPRATVQALDAALASAGRALDVLHLACHATFDPDDPARSGLQLAPAEADADADADAASGWLSAEDVRQRRIPAELVVLSACVSGRTRVESGDEPSGLVRSFLFAGAAAVLASLWRVDDLSTRLLVDGYYQALLQPAPRWRKAQALRQAALALRRRTLGEWQARLGGADAERLAALAAAAGIAADQPVFEAPYHWAPFMLVGDWG